jgi:hypothetical protein
LHAQRTHLPGGKANLSADRRSSEETGEEKERR